MHKSILALCEVLDATSAAVLAVQTDNRRLPDLIGTWHVSTLNREQFADIPASISARLRDDDTEQLSAEIAKKIDNLTESIRALGTTIVPNLFNGNAIHSSDPYLNTFQYASFLLDGLFGWRSLPVRTAMPTSQTRRLATLENHISSLEVNSQRVQDQLQAINSAYEAAENLPATNSELQQLIRAATNSSEQAIAKLQRADEELTKISKTLLAFNSYEEEADRIVARCKEVYQFATSTGLAGAFDLRAQTLARSLWIWVVGLLIALSAGGIIGYWRVAEITEILRVPQTPKGDLLVQLILSLVTMGAPVWFAWMATKQIGQRFRLSEDYAYKATLAKAYEGYRAEAIRIDPELEKRLFTSALNRLDEPPLRLVEAESHGSPFHEIGVKNIVDRIKKKKEVPQSSNSTVD